MAARPAARCASRVFLLDLLRWPSVSRRRCDRLLRRSARATGSVTSYRARVRQGAGASPRPSAAMRSQLSAADPGALHAGPAGVLRAPAAASVVRGRPLRPCWRPFAAAAHRPRAPRAGGVGRGVREPPHRRARSARAALRAPDALAAGAGRARASARPRGPSASGRRARWRRARPPAPAWTAAWSAARAYRVARAVAGRGRWVWGPRRRPGAGCQRTVAPRVGRADGPARRAVGRARQRPQRARQEPVELRVRIALGGEGGSRTPRPTPPARGARGLGAQRGERLQHVESGRRRTSSLRPVSKNTSLAQRGKSSRAPPKRERIRREALATPAAPVPYSRE